jgi:hypothetical protein
LLELYGHFVLSYLSLKVFKLIEQHSK